MEKINSHCYYIYVKISESDDKHIKFDKYIVFLISIFLKLGHFEYGILFIKFFNVFILIIVFLNTYSCLYPILNATFPFWPCLVWLTMIITK